MAAAVIVMVVVLVIMIRTRHAKPRLLSHAYQIWTFSFAVAVTAKQKTTEFQNCGMLRRVDW
jgi:hypothetical protein